MKRFLFIALALLAQIGVFAQSTVTNAWFIRVNDLIYGATDSLPSASLVTAASANAQTWDFSALNPMVKDTFEVFSAASGANAATFPLATFRVPIMGGDGYGRITATKTEIIGFSGDLGLGSPVSVAFSDPVEFQQAPINYGNMLNNTSGLRLTLAIADYPQIGALINGQLPAGATADSLRVNRTTSTSDVVDAHGTAILQAGTFSVLRLNRTEMSDIKIEIRIKLSAFLPAFWVDPSTLSGGATIPGTGKDTTYNHIFVSNNERQPVADISLAKGTFAPVSARYLYAPTAVGTQNSLLKAAALAMPNPASSEIRITTSALPQGNYTLRFQNVLGQAVHSQTINANENTTIDTKNWQNGTYFYAVMDNNGNTSPAKQVIVLH